MNTEPQELWRGSKLREVFTEEVTLKVGLVMSERVYQVDKSGKVILDSENSTCNRNMK